MAKKKQRRGPQASPDAEKGELSGDPGSPVGVTIESLKGAEASSEEEEGEKGQQSKRSEVSEGQKEENLVQPEVTGVGKGKRSSRRKNAEHAAAEAPEENRSGGTEGEEEEKKRSSNKRRNAEHAAEAPKEEEQEDGPGRGWEGDPEPSGKAEAPAPAVAADGSPWNRKASTRVWSEDDVIKLLKGVVECQEENGVDTGTAIDHIHKHIHETLHMEFSRSQLYEKMRRLRQKFQIAISRTKGNYPISMKPHDQAVFELSMKIWTSEKLTHPAVGVENQEASGAGAYEGAARAGVLYPNLREAVSHLEKEGKYFMGVGLLKEGFQLLKPSKGKELEERCKANHLAGMKLLLENSKLKEELLQACVEALDTHVP